MIRRGFAARFAALLLCLPLAAPAVTPTLRVEHYMIWGVTARELRAQMDKYGPVGLNGIRADGYTAWNIQWRFDYDRTRTTCTAIDIRVTVDLRMTMPRWIPPARATPALIARWKRFETALRRHEDGHVAIATESGDEVLRVLHAKPGGRDCAEVGARLNAAGQAVLEESKRRQDRYDRDTDSGRKQGTTAL